MPVICFNLADNSRGMSSTPFIVFTHGEEPEGWKASSRVGLSGGMRVLQDVSFDYAFPQIEADAFEIDMNSKFAVYYAEKRPFFLEWKQLFETPITAVFARSINDPIIALKGVGSFGTVTLGYIGAFDRHARIMIPLSEETISLPSNKESWSDILRARYEPARGQRLGILFTDRRIQNVGTMSWGLMVVSSLVESGIFELD